MVDVSQRALQSTVPTSPSETEGSEQEAEQLEQHPLVDVVLKGERSEIEDQRSKYEPQNT